MSDVLGRYGARELDQLRPAIEDALRGGDGVESRTINSNVLELEFDHRSGRVVVTDVCDGTPAGKQELTFDELRARLAGP